MHYQTKLLIVSPHCYYYCVVVVVVVCGGYGDDGLVAKEFTADDVVALATVIFSQIRSF